MFNQETREALAGAARQRALHFRDLAKLFDIAFADADTVNKEDVTKWVEKQAEDFDIMSKPSYWEQLPN